MSLSMQALGCCVFILLASFGCAGRSDQAVLRSTCVLQSGWRFISGDAPGASRTQFDDSQWQSISVPHTWNTDDGHDGANDYYRGVGWYRIKIPINDLHPDQNLFLRFEGAALVTQVFLNEKFVGEHHGGFSAFCFDITQFVHPGENVLAVRVDNARHEDVPPLSGDFTIFGGIYRNVQLISKPAVHISPVDDASSGVYLRQLEVSRERAKVEILAKLRNTSALMRRVEVVADIRDAQGRAVARASRSYDILANSVLDAIDNVEIKAPRLWDGVRDPYLYQASVRIMYEGQIIDAVTQPLGLRFYLIDTAKGLLLNGTPYPFRGVNLHQETYGKGWAGTKEDRERDYAMIREMGCTGVRMSHYQHDAGEYEICDRDGLVVWDELALVNEITPSNAFAQCARQQLTEQIKQTYNHPSILVRGLFNEINISTGDPRWNLVRELNELSHALDGSRPTCAASNLGLDHESIRIPDVIAFNRYWGWYSDRPEDWESKLEEIRRRVPDRPFGISEFGAGASVLQHEIPPRRPVANGQWHPEEWQNHFHECAWKAQSRRKDLWCNLIWVMFDFAAAGRNEGDWPGRNDKGLVTADRGTRKDSFYFYKANWSNQPFVYITSRRFNPRPAGEYDVKVYSNCRSVQLTVNGVNFGSRDGDCGVFVWKNVLLKRGSNVITAQGDDHSDSIRWECSP